MIDEGTAIMNAAIRGASARGTAPPPQPRPPIPAGSTGQRLRAAAYGRLQDPTDAVGFLADELDGATDDELHAAIDDLLDRKPYLARVGPGPGGFDGGTRDGPGSKYPDPDMNVLLRASWHASEARRG